ncbi:MAG: hypothetical protein ACKO6N_18165 [Myxococcota bacterium]
MTKELRPSDWDQLMIVGTTTPVEVSLLPQRLVPVYQHPADVEHVWVPIPSVAQTLYVSVEPLSWFQEQCAEENAQRFDLHLEAKDGHVLMQLELGALPEQILPHDLRARLDSYMKTLFQKIEEHLKMQQVAEAFELSSRVFAAAHARDAVPSLLQLALARQMCSPDDIQWLEGELLAAYPSYRQEDSFSSFSRGVGAGLPRVRRAIEEELYRRSGHHAVSAEYSLSKSPTSAPRVPPSRPDYLPSSSRSAPERRLTQLAA